METAVRARSRYNQSQHSCHTRYHLYSTAVTTTAVEKAADGDSCQSQIQVQPEPAQLPDQVPPVQYSCYYYSSAVTTTDVSSTTAATSTAVTTTAVEKVADGDSCQSQIQI